MGSLFGGGGKASAMQDEAARREMEASAKQSDLLDKQQVEADKLKAEEDMTKAQLEERRRRIASGSSGRRSLFTADETGYVQPGVSRTIGAS